MDDIPVPRTLPAPPEEPAASISPRRRWPWLLPVMATAIGLAAVSSGEFGRDPDVASPVLIEWLLSGVQQLLTEQGIS